MNNEQLIDLLENLTKLPKENEWLEFKENNYKPEEIGKRLSALSNSACLENKPFGYLIFGVNDRNHSIVGTHFKPKREKIGTNELENWLNQMLTPRTNFKIYELKYKTKDIVIIEISAAIDRLISFQSEEFIRIGSITRKLKDFPEKEKLIWKNHLHKSFEKEIAKQSLSSDEILNILDYPKYFELTQQNLPPNKEGILEKLIQESFIKKNKSKFDITNLGAILFAKNLMDFETVKRKSIRVIIYKGKNKLETIKEQEGKKGYAVGFEGLIDYINDQLPSNEEIGRALRVDKKIYPEIAIRELVANAIIHQSFYESGCGPMVEIYEDRIEISNPGAPIININRFIDHSPKSRNENLASFMRMIGICEERGSGIDKVIASIEVFQLPAPIFQEFDDFTRVVLFKYKTLSEMDKQDKIRACYQHCCLRYISHDFMKNNSLRERFNINDKNYPMASKIIADTVKVNLIKLSDNDSESNRNKKYIPFWA